MTRAWQLLFPTSSGRPCRHGARRLAGWLALGLVLADPSMPRAAPAMEMAASAFETRVIGAESHAALPVWKKRFRELAHEIGALERCVEDERACTRRSRLAWAHFLRGLAGTTSEERLEAVNRFGNDHKARPFASASNVEPETGPEPAAEVRAALYKYASLRVLGVAAERLRIVEARDLLADRRTVLVLVRTDAAAWLLRPDTPALVEAGRLSQLLPLLSLNEHARWVHLPPVRESRPARLAPLPAERR